MSLTKRRREEMNLSLHAALLFWLLGSSATFAIECSCTSCVTSPSCFGEHCFVITHPALATTGEAAVTTIRGCYNDSLNCGLNSATLGVTVDCCESDLCNDASFQPASPGGTNIPTPPREVPATPSPLSPNLKPYTSSNLPTDVPEDSTTGSVPTSPESETDTVEATDEGPFVPPVLIPSGGPMDPSPSSDGTSESTATTASNPQEPTNSPTGAAMTPEEEEAATTTSPTHYSATPITSPSCHRSDSLLESVKPICSMSSAGCYTTWRRRASGLTQLRRGCSTRPCVEESRNRKIKTCCNSSFCNDDTVNPFLIEENGSSQENDGNNNNSTASPPTEQQTSSISQQPSTTTPSAPPITTVTQPTPSSYRPPSLMSITVAKPSALPFTLECECDVCNDQPTCQSNLGCATKFEVSGTAALNRIRRCITERDVCGDNGLLCCFSESFCNGQAPTLPHTQPVTDTETPPATQATPTNGTTTTTTTTPLAQGGFPYITVATVLAVVIGVASLVVMAIIMLALWVRYKREERSLELKKHSNKQPRPLERKIESLESTPTLEQGIGTSECATTSSSDVSAVSSTSSSHKQTSV